MEFSKNDIRPASKKRIKELQDWFGVTFPADFVHFLQTANGAVPVENVFYQGDRDRVIERFLCVLDDHRNDTVNGWYDIGEVFSQVGDRLVDDDDMVGTDDVPIAALFGGDLLCLDFRSTSKSPSVAVWDHELSEVDHVHLEKVSDSFGEFIQTLKPMDEDH